MASKRKNKKYIITAAIAGTAITTSLSLGFGLGLGLDKKNNKNTPRSILQASAYQTTGAKLIDVQLPINYANKRVIAVFNDFLESETKPKRFNVVTLADNNALAQISTFSLPNPGVYQLDHIADAITNKVIISHSQLTELQLQKIVKPIPIKLIKTEIHTGLGSLVIANNDVLLANEPIEVTLMKEDGNTVKINGIIDQKGNIVANATSLNANLTYKIIHVNLLDDFKTPIVNPYDLQHEGIINSQGNAKAEVRKDNATNPIRLQYQPKTRSMQQTSIQQSHDLNRAENTNANQISTTNSQAISPDSGSNVNSELLLGQTNINYDSSSYDLPTKVTDPQIQEQERIVETEEVPRESDAEKEERLRREEEEKKKLEEELRKKKEELAKQTEEQRRLAEEQEKARQAELQRQLDEIAKKQEEEAKKREQEEEKARQEKIRIEQELKQQIEAQIKALEKEKERLIKEIAQKQIEEEKRRELEEAQRLKEEQEKERLRQLEEAQRREEERKRQEAEEAARKAAEEERLRQEETKRIQEQKAEEERLKKLQEQQEEEKRQKELEIQRKLKAAEDARLERERQAKLEAEIQELARLKAEQERKEAEEKRKQEQLKKEEEARKLALLEEQKRQKLLAEQKEKERKKREAEIKKQQEEAKKRAQEELLRKQKAEEERIRIETEKRVAAELEKQRREAELEAKRKEEERREIERKKQQEAAAHAARVKAEREAAEQKKREEAAILAAKLAAEKAAQEEKKRQEEQRKEQAHKNEQQRIITAIQKLTNLTNDQKKSYLNQIQQTKKEQTNALEGIFEKAKINEQKEKEKKRKIQEEAEKKKQLETKKKQSEKEVEKLKTLSNTERAQILKQIKGAKDQKDITKIVKDAQNKEKLNQQTIDRINQSKINTKKKIDELQDLSKEEKEKLKQEVDKYVVDPKNEEDIEKKLDKQLQIGKKLSQANHTLKEQKKKLGSQLDTNKVFLTKEQYERIRNRINGINNGFNTDKALDDLSKIKNEIDQFKEKFGESVRVSDVRTYGIKKVPPTSEKDARNNNELVPGTLEGEIEITLNKDILAEELEIQVDNQTAFKLKKSGTAKYKGNVRDGKITFDVNDLKPKHKVTSVKAQGVMLRKKTDKDQNFGEFSSPQYKATLTWWDAAVHGNTLSVAVRFKDPTNFIEKEYQKNATSNDLRKEGSYLVISYAFDDNKHNGRVNMALNPNRYFIVENYRQLESISRDSQRDEWNATINIKLDNKDKNKFSKIKIRSIRLMYGGLKGGGRSTNTLSNLYSPYRAINQIIDKYDYTALGEQNRNLHAKKIYDKFLSKRFQLPIINEEDFRTQFNAKYVKRT